MKWVFSEIPRRGPETSVAYADLPPGGERERVRSGPDSV